jgi:hypothetical protein
VIVGEWLELLRALGQSLADLAKAELAALQAELARNGRTLALALGLFGAALATGFWLIALLIYTVIQVLAIWLPLWGASLLVTGLFALLVATLALVGWLKLRRLESPAATFGRRWQGHRDWWDRRLLAESPPPAGLPPPGLVPGPEPEAPEEPVEPEEEIP